MNFEIVSRRHDIINVNMRFSENIIVFVIYN